MWIAIRLDAASTKSKHYTDRLEIEVCFCFSSGHVSLPVISMLRIFPFLLSQARSSLLCFCAFLPVDPQDAGHPGPGPRPDHQQVSCLHSRLAGKPMFSLRRDACIYFAFSFIVHKVLRILAFQLVWSSLFLCSSLLLLWHSCWLPDPSCGS